MAIRAANEWHSLSLLLYPDINYVHQLVDSQARRGDFTEAGLTLKLHASLYEWDESVFVDPFHFGDLSFPRQSHFGRKESLYLQTLDYLGRGKVRTHLCTVSLFSPS